MKKVLKEVIFAIYIIVAILVTMCLLSYNSFKVSEFGSKTLVIVKELDENIILASRNLQNIALIEATEINVLDLIAADKVLITKEAVNKIEEVLA